MPYKSGLDELLLLEELPTDIVSQLSVQSLALWAFGIAEGLKGKQHVADVLAEDRNRVLHHRDRGENSWISLMPDCGLYVRCERVAVIAVRKPRRGRRKNELETDFFVKKRLTLLIDKPFHITQHMIDRRRCAPFGLAYERWDDEVMKCFACAA
jgi:hypothetical protein